MDHLPMVGTMIAESRPEQQAGMRALTELFADQPRVSVGLIDWQHPMLCVFVAVLSDSPAAHQLLWAPGYRLRAQTPGEQVQLLTGAITASTGQIPAESLIDQRPEPPRWSWWLVRALSAVTLVVILSTFTGLLPLEPPFTFATLSLVLLTIGAEYGRWYRYQRVPPADRHRFAAQSDPEALNAWAQQTLGRSGPESLELDRIGRAVASALHPTGAPALVGRAELTELTTGLLFAQLRQRERPSADHQRALEQAQSAFDRALGARP